jgi:hypothetical protein
VDGGIHPQKITGTLPSQVAARLNGRHQVTLLRQFVAYFWLAQTMKLQAKHYFGSLALLLVFLASGYVYQHSSAYVRAAPEDRNGLWIAAAKGFEGRVRYVGSLGDHSYFRTGDWFCSRYKAPTAKLHLPRTFPLDEGVPYDVTFEMVPRYP